jgi:hypothetical protein
MTLTPNKSDAPNAAMPPLVKREHRWRGIGDPRRSTDTYTARHSAPAQKATKETKVVGRRPAQGFVSFVIFCGFLARASTTLSAARA